MKQSIIMPIKKKNIRDFEVEENNFSADQSNNKTQNKSGLSGSLLILPMLVAIIIAGWFGYDWYRSEREVERLSQKPTAEKMSADTAVLLGKIKKHMFLPEEDPTIATITDAENLIQQQPFYAGAQNGDKLLIFPNAKKAIIYSEARDKLINVGPIYFNANKAADESEATTATASEATDTEAGSSSVTNQTDNEE
ncbi:MAG: hypothetical protein BWY53_00541 [Parcubacteria group bacterium ADurb.Bin326]|nr:MAG: hypothetical protein BWY53_00541 [Parcubacteria group bacterium ADurb.Bin326]